MICNLGMCLLQSGKLWGIKKYFFDEVPYYIKNYRQNYFKAYLAAIFYYPQRFLYKFISKITLKNPIYHEYSDMVLGCERV
jgi:hypothetical protein